MTAVGEGRHDTNLPLHQSGTVVHLVILPKERRRTIVTL